jgi:CheY-like chemotaxis protein
LPDINGIELVTRLKQDEFTSKIPIVAVTALARMQDREQILQAGCEDYLSKPYMLNELENIICYYCQKIAN